MKYVRNLDDLKKYTFEFFDSFLEERLSDEMVNYFLVDLGDKKILLDKILLQISKKPLDVAVTAEYGEVILQLMEYKELLKKFTELLLLSHSFEALCAFLNRIFLQQVGNVTYKSVKKQYSIKERYFDRFIEIVMFCKIEKSLFSPFFIAIFSSDETSPLCFFKEPLKEYLDIFLKDGEDDSFITSLLSSEKQAGINEYASTNTVKTLRTLINEFVKGEINNTSLIKKALVSHKQEGFNISQEMLQSNESDTIFKAVQLLSLLEDDRRVKDRLKDIYETSNDPKIKAYLEKECGFNSLQNFASKEEFESFVDKNILQIQERLYGSRLKKYYEKFGLDNSLLNGKILTFVMETFKNKNTDNQIFSLRDYLKFVDGEVLKKLSRVVYETAMDRNKLLASKWALRLIAMFASSDLLIDITENMKVWILDKKLDKTCRYFLDLLALCSREEILQIVKSLQNHNLSPKQMKFLSQKLETFSSKSKQNFEIVKDKLIDDLGFNSNGTRILSLENREILLRINLDCSISIFNAKNGKPARLKGTEKFNSMELKKYVKLLEKNVKEQRKRLNTAFLEFRNYDIVSFEETIVKNNLLNLFAQNLVWGRYKNNKLVEICLFKDDKLVHLAGNIVIENFENYNIAILQPIDCEDIKKELQNKFETLFNQFDLPVFKEENLSLNANYVDSLSGVFCNAKLFVTRLEKLKYKINDLDSRRFFGTLLKENKELNLLTCVEFDKMSLDKMNCSITISKVRFFELNKQIKNGKKFTLDKTEALTLRDIEPHILSNELAQILLACKS
ncbi:MAG: DUF4132 domain-containing protein [Clostridia bacterium]|nr:DUF4132 domain-containing protein [Clostridia bacterium]